jgi:FkbM family methyltransferase
MKKLLINSLKKIAKPLLGTGVIDTHLPFLIPLFQTLYGRLAGKKEVVLEIPLGVKLTVFQNDIGVGLPLLLKGAFEPMQTGIFLQKVKQNTVFVDIGANCGYYSMLAGKLATKGKVIAFEPDSENFALLVKNTTLNGLKNITAQQKAVSDKDGISYFSSEKLNKGESSLSKDLKGEAVQAVTLDSYLKSKKISHIDVLKIDIEGAELFALKEAFVSLKNGPTTLFIEYNPSRIEFYGFEPEELIERVKQLGFKIESIIDETKKQILPYSEGNLGSVMSHATYCNLLCHK